MDQTTHPYRQQYGDYEPGHTAPSEGSWS
jgi:hypothetical protein